jgi:phosphoglycolate phosphatase-like HAD superfamily hydrolase
MNNKRYQHILFDLDGTLTDPMIGITSSVKYALSYFNIFTIFMPFHRATIKNIL